MPARVRALDPAAEGQRRCAVARSSGRCAGVFTEAAMHTPVEVTERRWRRCATAGADCLVALGGGSTTGLGKAIALRTDLPTRS